MRAACLTGARAVLLAGPTVLAFFAGGYFAEARSWAGPGGLGPRCRGAARRPERSRASRAAWLAIGGLGAVRDWTLLSITWAPIAGSAYHAGQIAFLYVGGLLASTMLLRERWRAASGRAGARGRRVDRDRLRRSPSGLLPGVLHVPRSVSARGPPRAAAHLLERDGRACRAGLRAVRVGSPATRHATRAMRSLAAAACAPLGLGLYLSFSRGALFACAAGLVVLLVIGASGEQLRALGVVIVAGGLSVAAAAAFRGVTSLVGSQSSRERAGGIALAILVIVMLAAAFAQRYLERHAQPARLRLPRAAPTSRSA